MDKIVLPLSTVADANEALKTYAAQRSKGYVECSSALQALLDYRARLQAFLDEQQPDKPPPASVAGLFTSDNLPDAARVTAGDFSLLRQHGFYKATDHITANILNRLCATRPGLREWLLNGTAPAPAFTDEPPEVTDEDVKRNRDVLGTIPDSYIRAIIECDRRHFWQTHRPKPTDPVRFALEKVTRNQWAGFVHAVLEAASTPETDTHYVAREELARILPVAETPKQWAELTDEAAWDILQASFGQTGRDNQISAFRQAIAAYAPPPRKVEVTAEAVYAMSTVTDQGAVGTIESIPNFVEGLQAFLDVAHDQADARESEAVERLRMAVLDAQTERDNAETEVARLRSLIGDDNITALSEGRAWMGRLRAGCRWKCFWMESGSR